MSSAMLVVGLLALGAAPAEEVKPKLTLHDVVAEALAHNPELEQAQAAVGTSQAGVGVAGGLAEPFFSYQAWQQPFSRPVDPGATNMHMIGLRQSLPFPGQRGRAEKAAAAGVDAVREDARGVRLRVEAQVGHALVTDWRQAEELRVHLEHMQLAERTLEAIRSRYISGGGTQSDILRAETALHRLHADIAGIQASRASATALLNALMGRDVDAPILEPETPSTELPEGAQLRPEVLASGARVEQAHRMGAMVDRARNAPELMVGFDYMLTPRMPDAYSVMVQVGLPWLSSKRKAEADQAQHQVVEAQAAEAVAKNAARFELAESRSRAEAARRQLQVLSDDVLPRARHALDAARSSYVTGGADLVSLLAAQSELLDTELAVVRQRSALADAVVDLRRALGIDVISEGKS